MASIQVRSEQEILLPQVFKNQVIQATQSLMTRQADGLEYTGWIHWPSSISDELLADVTATAKELMEKVDYLVVIGIGGSYLGARAAIDVLTNRYDMLSGSPEHTYVLYAGTDLSGLELSRLVEFLAENSFGINMISKSGTTTEPAIAFRILRKLLIQKHGLEGANERIIATTDAKRGALHTLASQNKLKSYIIPNDIGGRYSVLTPVGLFPIAVAGGNIMDMVEGARAAERELTTLDFNQNPALQYVAYRNYFYRKGLHTEILVHYEPCLKMISEWWKQLFGESEGKQQRGIFPASAQFTTDLHSLGQYIQDGRRFLFETVLNIRQTNNHLLIPSDEQNLDGLNYLAGKPVDYVNEKARLGTLEAHLEGQVPNITIDIADLSAFTIGYLFYFFEFSCAVSGYMLGVNPFDQPGVEAYKKNMFRLLNKPV